MYMQYYKMLKSNR